MYLHDVGDCEDNGAHIKVTEGPGQAQATWPDPEGPPALCIGPSCRPLACRYAQHASQQ